jgi:hypothetical protein
MGSLHPIALLILIKYQFGSMFYTIYYKRELKNFESERVAASEPVETSGAAARELVIEGRNIAVESRAS